MIIQDAIDALASQGGTVRIPAGDFSTQPPIVMRDNVRLLGEGWSTVIPPIAAGADRRWGLGLEHLIVDAMHSPGYAIDWRYITNSRVVNVLARNCTYGLVLMGVGAYYNYFEQLFVDASVCAVEMTAQANQNAFRGGKWTAPLCLRAYGSNFLTFDSVALEGSNVTTFRDIQRCTNVRAINVREENALGTNAWNA